LGISCYYHDAAAVILKDGVLIAAAEEERFSRIKHDSGYPRLAIQFCLQQAGIQPADLDYVVFYEQPLVKFERILMTTLGAFPRTWKVFGEAMIGWFDQKLWIKTQLLQELGLKDEQILFTEHHLSHAASAFFASPFEEAAILTIDGVGEWTTAAMGHASASWQDGAANTITLTHEQRFPHSLGLLYSAFTAFLGFEVNEGEYKVMGMSPYGTPRHVDKIEKVFKSYADGSFWLDMDYFAFHYSERSISRKFTDLFGPARVHESEFYTAQTNPEVDPNAPKTKENQYYADVAASIQHVTEEAILKLARVAHERTGSKRLCLAGGVALNSKANGRLLTETPFEDVYIQPAAGDSGGALGAALYAYHVILGQPRVWVQEHNFWGAEYGEDDMQAAITEAGLPHERVNDESKLVAMAVDDLLDGKVLAWYQGRFEWGPRALGNRSIIADPRRGEMKDIVNTKIKFREPFRPFAPFLPEEDAARYFPDYPHPERSYPMRFMLTVGKWDEALGEAVPAVNHLGTGRMQTVRREWNPRYYDLVKHFGQATGVPVLMNTSYNLRGEPIVTTPANALSTFMNSGLDTLVMGDYLVRKPG
jgi:carbamoyltransferase